MAAFLFKPAAASRIYYECDRLAISETDKEDGGAIAANMYCLQFPYRILFFVSKSKQLTLQNNPYHLFRANFKKLPS